MGRNLYRDEKNCPTNPTKIERDFATFESEVSQIIKDRFLYLREIKLSSAECEKLKLFFALMGFRSKIVSDQFGLKASDQSRKFYTMYQKDGDLSDLWKRNLGYIVNCRSLSDVLNNNNIDDPIKAFMMRDVFGLCGQYFVIAERKESEQFIITDTYPTVINGDAFGMQLHLYSIFPISPDRIILLASIGVENAPRNVVNLRNCVFTVPKTDYNKNKIMFVKKLYDEEVRFINSVLVKEASEGWAFKDDNKF